MTEISRRSFIIGASAALISLKGTQIFNNDDQLSYPISSARADDGFEKRCIFDIYVHTQQQTHCVVRRDGGFAILHFDLGPNGTVRWVAPPHCELVFPNWSKFRLDTKPDPVDLDVSIAFSNTFGPVPHRWKLLRALGFTQPRPVFFEKFSWKGGELVHHSLSQVV